MELVARLYHWLHLRLIEAESVPYHWYPYIAAYDIGISERKADAARKDTSYTDGGRVLKPSRANELLERMRAQAQQGARER